MKARVFNGRISDGEEDFGASAVRSFILAYVLLQ
jgi:hypothetical protein